MSILCRLRYSITCWLIVLSASLAATLSHAADYPPVGSEISSLQEACNQANDSDTIRARNKIFNESLLLDRPISISLNGGYSDASYSATSGFTRLHGPLTIKNGTLKVRNLVIGGGTSGLSISSVTVAMPRISWSTAQAADSRVDYGETASYGSTVSGTSPTTSHNLVLTGLKPNTTYHYIVSSSTSSASAATADNTFTTPDFIAASIADVGSSAIIEVAGNFDTISHDNSINSVPRQKIAQEYIRNHSDNMDFLVMFSTFDYALPAHDAQGVYMAVKNDTQGINQPLFDNSALYGSNSRLQGTIDMGNVTALAANLTGGQLNQTLTILSHELAHRFGAYVRYKLPDNSLSTTLLGLDNSHWSYLLDSQGSVMYGNGWNDNNNGSFTSASVMNSYSPLDLYLMGMLPKEQVSPMLLIDNPAVNKTALPSIGSGISGTATTVSIADIVAAEGERVPNVSTSQKQFNVGYILLVRHGDTMGQAAQTLDMIRKGFAGRFAEMTHGIGSIANVPASLEVAIDTPLDNANITGPTLHVTGTVLNSSGAETGVVVNGVTAIVSGVRFTANNIDLLPGTNSIAVIASDVNGRSSTASRTVTAHTGNYIRVTPSVESGGAPLNLTLTVDSPFSISSSSLYSSGPIGVSQLPGSSPTSYLMRLPVEGSYTFMVQVNGPDGQNYADSVVISVLPRRQLDNLLRSKWQAVTTDLAAGETTAPLAHFTPMMRPKYQAVFAEVAPLLPSILATHQGLANVSMDGEITKYELTTLEEGALHAYDIVFIKDDDGIWRIRSY